MQLHTLAFGLTFGILTAFAVFLCALLAMFFNYGTSWVYLVGQYYIGYAPTWLGALIGAAYGFLDGLLGGVLISWLYNRLAQKFSA